MTSALLEEKVGVAGFEVGDEVECVDAGYGLGLSLGNKYRVGAVQGSGRRSCLALEGSFPETYWTAQRFRKVSPVQEAIVKVLPFEVGDEVECVDIRGTNGLLLGRKYHVAGLRGWLGGQLQLVGQPESVCWDHFRFRKVTAGQEGITPVQEAIAKECDALKIMLLEKNKSYGNSALEPLGVFAKGLTVVQQIGVRIDDKLNRLKKGTEFANEDTIKDLIGYLILLRVAQRT